MKHERICDEAYSQDDVLVMLFQTPNLISAQAMQKRILEGDQSLFSATKVRIFALWMWQMATARASAASSG